MAKKASEEPLFRSVASDGKTVMLSVADDGTWRITRDGEQVAEGNAEAISIAAAVRKFRALVNPRKRTK